MSNVLHNLGGHMDNQTEIKTGILWRYPCEHCQKLPDACECVIEPSGYDVDEDGEPLPPF
jgi:hypothetical protein